MREYELYVPFFHNDGRTVDSAKHQRLKAALIRQFGGVTFSSHPYEAVWTMGGITYRDSILFYRILTQAGRTTRVFFREIKEQLKQELEQEEILIVERRVKRL